MEEERLIELVDLEVSRKITLIEAIKLKSLPLYTDNKSVYVVTCNKKIDNNLLNFIFQKEIKLILKEEKIVLELINIILDYEDENIEKKIIEEGVNNRASDIHFEPVESELKIRMRINGSLVLKRILKIDEYGPILSRLKINSSMNTIEKRKPQDGKMSIQINKVIYNCRFSTIPVESGEKLVIRILYSDSLLSSINNLNFTSKQLINLKKILAIKNGLVIINGPTGSGKSTTLYSILNYAKKESVNITTLEDPIEAKIKGINQMSLNSNIGITFAEGLRSILRQDPDIIMLGEIRDEETAQISVRAAITGHKVYSTIHTKNPREVYLRLEEMGVKSYLIRDSLCGIISQRLIKTLCANCKIKIKNIELSNKKVALYKKCGCENCNGTGYTGRSMVAAVNYIDKEMIKKLKKVHDNEELLSNNEMLEVLNELLINEKIDYYDYLDFIEGEELDEKELQKYRYYM